ncbi:MAG: hypothetical protein IJF27_07980 [Oscillospiraceae bacterium]|nr:hypothetical protein [Oscillospiraceae bacterium]
MDCLKDIFEKWTPIESLGNRYDVDKIRYCEEGISFDVSVDEKEPAPEIVREFQIVWNFCDVISYHVTDETYRADCWGLDFENDGRFYISQKSDYIAELRKRSPLLPDNVIHFLIVGSNTVIDVLAREYPTVKALNV